MVGEGEVRRVSEVSLDLKKTICAVIGANGMLGSEFLRLFEASEVPCVRAAFGEFDKRKYAEVDITNPYSLEYFVREFSPKVIINCAAYTAVDLAETNFDLAFKVNSLGVRNLVDVCKTNNIKLVHFSTDYVFGGKEGLAERRSPYLESDACDPCAMYGYSKFFGEELIRAIYPENSLILRTSWLHGEGGPNFIDTISRLLSEKSELKIVSDQVGSLTWTPWLARTALRLLEEGTVGTIHVTASNECSWYEVGKKLSELLKSSCKVMPQSTEELARPAARPRYSKLNVSNLERILGEKVPTWEEFVESHLKKAERI